MAELFRFDFSRPNQGVPQAQASQLRRPVDHPRGRSLPVVPPAVRFAFLIAVCLTAGISAFAVSKLVVPLPKAAADEHILPATQPYSKLKSVAEVGPIAPPVVENRRPAQETRDSGMSLLVQLPPSAEDFPIPPPLPLPDKRPVAVPAEPMPVTVPEPLDAPEEIIDPLPVYDPAPVAQEIEAPKIEAPVFELPPTPPEVTIEKTPDPKPVVVEVEQPKKVAPEDDRILVYLESIHHGESPMLNTWKNLNYATVLAAALAAGQSAPAQDKEDPVVKQLEAMNSKIEKSFSDLNADLKIIQKNIDALQTISLEVDTLKVKVGKLEEAAKKMGDDLTAMRQKTYNDATFAPITKEQLDQAMNRIKLLEQKLADASSGNRIALSPSTNTGRIVLVNLYTEDLVFTVNGQTHRVPAGRSTPVENVPAGTVNYEMISPTWGRRANTQTNLTVNETLTLTAQ